MPSPIILGFNATESLCSINTVAIVVGGSWGTISAPLTPLNFSSENFASVYGTSARLATHTRRFSNETLYNEWSLLPPSFQRRFWDTGNRVVINKSIYGAALGIQSGGVFSAAAEAIEELAIRFVGRIITRILTSIGLDATQTSVSSNSTLYGINGNQTYDQNINSYSTTNTNFCIIQGSVGAIVQAGINFVFIGNFPSIRSVGLSLLNSNQFAQTEAIISYLRNVFSNSRAFALVGDAAAGLILPGVQIQILAT